MSYKKYQNDNSVKSQKKKKKKKRKDQNEFFTKERELFKKEPNRNCGVA